METIHPRTKITHLRMYRHKALSVPESSGYAEEHTKGRRTTEIVPPDLAGAELAICPP